MEVEQKLKMLEVIHIYGSLGSVYQNDSNFLDYGHQSNEQFAIKPSTSLKVIPEGRNDEPILDRAKILLKNAYSVAFMGFGFDSTNLERLDARNTCTPKLNIENHYGKRTIAATTHGLTTAEILKISGFLNISLTDTNRLPIELINNTCLSLLRETLILETID